MTKKAPRRTAERILEVTLDLFNRFGEPNVSTTLISAEMNISPGNLYYHYPAKEELVNSLFERYERSLSALLAAGWDHVVSHAMPLLAEELIAQALSSTDRGYDLLAPKFELIAAESFALSTAARDACTVACAAAAEAAT